MAPHIDSVIAIVREYGAWAPPIVFALAFGESLAFISLLIPGWGALVAIGARVACRRCVSFTTTTRCAKFIDGEIL